MNDLFLLFCTLLTLILTIGLTLFYSSVVRSKNSVSILVQSLLIFCISFAAWNIFSYKFIFADVEIGINQEIHNLFQFTFFYIAMLIPIGSIVERTSTVSTVIFCSLWGLLVYTPVAYLVWNPSGWLAQMGAYDFAGGIVVHISSGVAGLVAAIYCGRRADFFNLKLPFNISLAYLGFLLILLGWIGFNIGSSMELNVNTGDIAMNTLSSAICGILAWTLLQKLHPPNRIDMAGISFGGICGLVTVTPGAYGFSLLSASIIAFLSTVCCFYIARIIKNGFRFDDSLEVFSSHAAAGVIGSIFVAILGDPNIVGEGALKANVMSTFIVIVYSSFCSYVILMILEKSIGLRVSKHTEKSGLDISDHGEKVINI